MVAVNDLSDYFFKNTIEAWKKREEDPEAAAAHIEKWRHTSHGYLPGSATFMIMERTSDVTQLDRATHGGFVVIHVYQTERGEFPFPQWVGYFKLLDAEYHKGCGWSCVYVYAPPEEDEE